MLKILLSAVALLCLATNVQAAVSSEPIVVGNKYIVHSKVLNENREISIYTPQDYDADKQYHVIYLLDGEFYFRPAAGVLDALKMNRAIPDVIMVGVSTTIRVRDYLPPIEHEPKSPHQIWTINKFPQFGGTENFKQFLKTELFPYIENNYSTLPSRTIVGHSNAGVFALHSLFSEPELFQNYLIISAAAWYSEQELKTNFTNLIESNTASNKNLFITLGNEGRRFYEHTTDVVSNLNTNATNSLNWQFEHLDKETHTSVVYPSLIKGLTFLFSDFKLQDLKYITKYGELADITNRYRDLSQKYGFDVAISETVLSDVADEFFTHNKPEQAMAALSLFIQNYPESSFAHKSLADGYMKTKAFKSAKASYQKALDIVIQNQVNDPTVADFLNDMINLAASKL